MADSDKQILITPNISQTSFPQIKFVGKDNAPMYQTVQDDGTIAFSAAQGEVFSIGPTMATGTIFSANDISGVPLLKVLASGTVNVASGRLAIGTDTAVDGMALTLNGDGTSYEGIAFQVDGSTKWKMSTDSSGFYWDSQVNTMDINFRLRDSGGTQQKFRFTADGGTNSPKFVVGASSHTIPDRQAGIEIIDAGQSTLRVTDSDGNASSDFAQSGNDAYIINRVTNGDIKIRVNGNNELITLDGGNQTVTFNGEYTFPTSDGSANQVLQTDGNGALSFATVSGGGSDTNTFVIFGEESDNYAGTGSTGNANGYQFSYGNGAQNVSKSSSGADFGINVPVNCTLTRVDVVFANSGNRTSGTTTFVVVKNGTAQTGNLSTTHSAGIHDTHHTGLSHSFSAGDRFNLRTTTSSQQVGPMRMTAYFTPT